MKYFGINFVLVFLTAISLASPARAEFAGPPVWEKVFHHICENSQLANVQIRYPINSLENVSEDSISEVYLVGGYRFVESRIYVELYPAPGADELWIIDGGISPGSDAFPRFVAKLKMISGRIQITDQSGLKTQVNMNANQEARLGLKIEAGKLDLMNLDRRSGQTPAQLLFSAEIPEGVFIGYPVSPDPSAACGPPGLDIFLNKQDAPRWPIDVAEASLEARGPSRIDTVEDLDTWESLSQKVYLNQALFLVLCSANTEMGATPSEGHEIQIPSPRSVFSSDHLLSALIRATDDLLAAREIYVDASPAYWAALRKAPRIQRDPGPEGRPKLELSDWEIEMMEYVSRFLSQAAKELELFDEGEMNAPSHTIGQLRSGSDLAFRLSEGSNDGYGYELDIVGQRVDLAYRYLIIWAQNQFR